MYRIKHKFTNQYYVGSDIPRAHTLWTDDLSQAALYTKFAYAKEVLKDAKSLDGHAAKGAILVKL